MSLLARETPALVARLILMLALVLALEPLINARPGPSNTGPTSSRSALKSMGGTTIRKNGTVLQNVHIRGTLNIEADNVVIRNFVIEAGGHYGINIRSGKNILIEDGEITDMKSAGINGSNFTARRLRIHHSGNDAIKPGRNATIEDCWFYNLGYMDDAHADGIQMRSGHNVVIRRNYFDMPSDKNGYKNSICIILQSALSPIQNVTIEGNWINGGGYSIQVRDNGHGIPKNVRIVGNHFGSGYRFGPWRTDGTHVIAENRWIDTGALLNGQILLDLLPDISAPDQPSGLKIEQL